MSDDVKMIITGTVTIIIIAWVLTHSGDVANVTNAGAEGYAKAVSALEPK